MEINKSYYNCYVAGCFNSTINSELSFFKIPVASERRNEWLRLIHREDLIDSSSPRGRVCEMHFRRDSVIINSRRKLLKKNSFPQLFLPFQNDFVSKGIQAIVETADANVQSDCDFQTNAQVQSPLQILSIIAKVFIYLEREYEYMKTLNGDNCDLSPLADVLKRTAQATGFDEDDVIMVMEREGLADRLPDRARRKRKKSCDYPYKLCGSEDEKVLERNNSDITAEKESTGQAAISSVPTYVFLTSDTEQTQVKVEPEDNEDATSHIFLHEIPLLGSNSTPTYVFLTSDTEQTQVKVEPEDNEDVTSHNVLHEIPPLGSNDEYFNQDEDDKMDIEQYTFTGTRPNVPPNPTASVSEHADIKIEPADDH